MVSNATIGLLIAIKSYNLKGSVITTPFTFIATSNSIIWANLRPIFVDISKDSYNIDADLIEENIEADTVAILAVHCYGSLCNLEKIESIGNKYNLKIIYDAAHAFGVEYEGKSLLTFGDISVTSFHATKVFNTIEGGCIICKNKEDHERINRMINFGIKDEDNILEIGINGKLSEIHALMGVLNFAEIENSINHRAKIYNLYKEKLNSQKIKIIEKGERIKRNYAYMPILILEGKDKRNYIYNELKKMDIYTRKYFSPLITDVESYKIYSRGKKFPNATKVVEQILCLPISGSYKIKEIRKIIDIINKLI